MSDLLKGKTALITGGNSGIGLAMAKAYSDAGAKVFITARDETKLKSACQLLSNNADYFVCDVSDLSQLDKLYDWVSQKHGKLDFLVANAGVQFNLPLKDVTEENFDLVTNINYKGVFFTVQKALPVLNQSASVILISSIAAHNGYEGNSVYAASKAAVSQMGKNFAADLLQDKIRVNVISPGCVVTPIWDKVKKVMPDIVDKYSHDLIPANRFGDPKEIADLAMYLATAKFVNGQDFVIDGGETDLSLWK
jgi:NAD(P)-dependent dehydrogenase (short-subunit alcohol dehydrogenase family)